MKPEPITDAGFHPDKIPDFGNKYFTGNGYLGVRGTMEEYGKEQMAAVNLSGIYDRHGSAWREPLNAPNPLFVRVAADGTDYSLPKKEPAFHLQRLEPDCGLHERETVWNTPQGTLRIQSERFCSMADYHLLCLRCTVTADHDAELTVTLGIDGDVWDINGPHYETIEFSSDSGLLRALATTGENKHRIAVVQGISYPFEAAETLVQNPLDILRVIHFHAEAHQSYTISIFGTVYTSRDDSDPITAATRTVRHAMEKGYEAAKLAHSETWARLWENSRVLIEGDEEAQRALDYSIYHLHSIAPRYSHSMSIPARGLSGQTYKGAVFWDTELFMFDFFLLTEPEVARTLLRYRIDTLDGARSKARDYGLDGAFYAWESQEGGLDACSDYNVTDVFTGRPLRTFFRDKQVHISAAVAYAVMKYLRVTGDEAILEQGGAETVIECARFYRSLLVRRADAEQYEIHDVLGPDEYHERVNNNAYTNRMALFVFRFAAELIRTLQEKYPQTCTELNRKFSLETELQKCLDSAERLYLPKPDEKSDVIEQFDGYFKLEDTTPDVLRGRLLDPKEYWGGANGVAAQTQVIKQADTVAMLSLFSEDYSEKVLKANWNYYEPRTEHGSSLSACMYALLACRFGEPDLAYPFFLKSSTADLAGGGKQWAGSVYIGGTHPASAGGAWMTVVEGFGGVSVERREPVFQPRLPSGWKRLKFSVQFNGDTYVINITLDEIQIAKK